MIVVLAHLAPAMAGLVRRVRAGIDAIQSWSRGRRDFERLLSMDDKRLADLGLTRDDLMSAAGGGLFANPTGAIVRRAGEPAGRSVQDTAIRAPEDRMAGARAARLAG